MEKNISEFGLQSLYSLMVVVSFLFWDIEHKTCGAGQKGETQGSFRLERSLHDKAAHANFRTKQGHKHAASYSVQLVRRCCNLGVFFSSCFLTVGLQICAVGSADHH